MAEATVAQNDLDLSRELAREKLQSLKATRRSSAGREYYGSGGQSEARAAVGKSVVEDLGRWSDGDAGAGATPLSTIENNSRLEGFRQNVGARAQRFAQIQALRAQRRGQTPAQTATATASAFAQQAHRRVWQLIEEGVEDFAFTFLDLMIFSGPAAVAIFLTRLIGGNIFRGSGTISFRDVTVPRIPGYASIGEGAYRAVKVAAIGLISGLVYATLVILIIGITKPDILFKLGLCSMFGEIIKMFGKSCSLT